LRGILLVYRGQARRAKSCQSSCCHPVAHDEDEVAVRELLERVEALGSEKAARCCLK
jgi:hypothetical protein